MALHSLQALCRAGATILLLVLALPLYAEPVGRGVNVTVYSSPT